MCSFWKLLFRCPATFSRVNTPSRDTNRRPLTFFARACARAACEKAARPAAFAKHRPRNCVTRAKTVTIQLNRGRNLHVIQLPCISRKHTGPGESMGWPDNLMKFSRVTGRYPFIKLPSLIAIKLLARVCLLTYL